MEQKQMEIISLDQLLSSNHQYRRFLELWDIKAVYKQLSKVKKQGPHKGYTIERLFLCLLLQFMEDLSDRELERFLQENNAAKWFCGFGLTEVTPDYSVFINARSRIGTNLLSQIFAQLRDQLKLKGYMSEVFSFVDASHLVCKASLWRERDKAIQAKYEKLNNEILPEFSHDKQARIGCKGGNKFWYGYKKHLSVDIQFGLINKVAITPANVTDGQGFRYVCPSSGACYADKGYCTAPAKNAARAKGVHLAAFKKNNMKGKNFDLDKYYTKIRAPFERVFSQDNKRVRYVGIAKNQFAEFMNAICFNLKRLLVLSPPPKTA